VRVSRRSERFAEIAAQGVQDVRQSQVLFPKGGQWRVTPAFAGMTGSLAPDR